MRVRLILGFAATLLVMGSAGSARAQFYSDAYVEAECPDPPVMSRSGGLRSLPSKPVRLGAIC